MAAPTAIFPPRAAWIGSAHPFDLHESYLCFRSPQGWGLERPPTEARLLITADSRYRLWVNGRFVARGPARSYPQRQCVDALDITSFLQAGPNLLAVQVYQPGYSHFAYVHRGAAGLLAALAGADQEVLVSSSSWRVRRDPSFAAQVPRVSIYGSGVEERNLRLEEPWVEPGYDDVGWEPARLVAPLGGYPWTGMRLRELPLLPEREIVARLVQTRRGAYPTALAGDAHLALRTGWQQATAWKATPDGDGWWHGEIGDGEAAYWLFDLGRDHTCQGWAEVQGASGEERLAVSYAEKTTQGELVLSDPQTYCRVRLTDRFRLRPGSQLAESFALRGGRYLLFQLAGPVTAGFRVRFHVRVAEYPLEVARRPTPVDPDLAAVVELCETTVRACLHDGFVDNPWREAAQWVGDALPQSLALAALSDDMRPLRQLLRQAVDGAYPDGVLPGVVPGEVHAYTIVDYNFTWVELLALYWRLTEDRQLVEELWPALHALLERFDHDRNDQGLIISQLGRRLFLDWAPVSRREPNAIYNLHYLLALQEAVLLAEAGAEKPAEAGQERAALAARWRARAVELRAAARSAFWRDGRWYDDLEGTSYSQLATSLAVLTGAADFDEQGELLPAVAARSLDLHDEHEPGRMVLASPFMHHYVLDALRRHGHAAAALEIIRQRWGRWAQEGSPTTWENWNVDFPDGSQCHAFAAHPLYHLTEILDALN